MHKIEDLADVFRYDPLTGFLYWKVDAGQRGRVGCRAGATKIGGKVRYMTVSWSGVTYFVHTLIWALHHKKWPEGEIDHINGQREDNSVANLRDVSHADNVKNAARRHDNRSGLTGVCWNKKKRRWIVQIGKSGTVHQVGGFHDFFDACCSRKSTEQRLGYHENHGRSQPC